MHCRRSCPDCVAAFPPASLRPTRTDTAAVDADEFDALVREARAAGTRGDLVAAGRQYDAALALWRGGRLVEKEDLRGGHEARGQVESASHAAGIGLGRPVAGLGQLEALEKVACSLPGR
jgi:Bacterial transcriptional activator domain